MQILQHIQAIDSLNFLPYLPYKLLFTIKCIKQFLLDTRAHTHTYMSNDRKNYHLQLVIMIVTSLNTLSRYNFSQTQRNLALKFATMMIKMMMMMMMMIAGVAIM